MTHLHRMLLAVLLIASLCQGPSAAGAAAELELHHPDFHGRLGLKLFAVVGETPGAAKLKATLKGPGGEQVILDKREQLAAEEIITLNLRDLRQGNYTLTVDLLDKDGLALKSAAREFSKPYDGIPRVGLDEHNALCVEGRPFFPVTTWGVGEKEADFDEWGSCVNTFMGYTFTKEHATIAGWKKFLDAAHRHGKMVIGPDYGAYWPNGDCRRFYTKDGQQLKDRAIIMAALEDYVQQTKDHPALLMWSWLDEPELDMGDNCVPPSEVRKWTDTCHRLDAQHPVYLNTGGGGFARPVENWLHRHMKRYTYLYNDIDRQPRVTLADVLGEDIYPRFGESLKKATAARAADQAAGKPLKELPNAENMIGALKNVRKYNRDLTAVFVNVGTAHLNDDTIYTPAEIRLCFWAQVINGAKGVAWFHYFKETPAENKKEMARCLGQVTRLTPVILGPDYPGKISATLALAKKPEVQTADSVVLETLAKPSPEGVYIFAANIKEETGQATFSLDFAPRKIEVLDENREIKAVGQTFADSFDPLGVHIYKVSK